MSDIAQNSQRYGTGNTRRSDLPNPHNGEVVETGVLGFDCSGFVCHVLIESGYRLDYESTRGLISCSAFDKTEPEDVRPGDIILFSGHVGIVVEYDHQRSLGRFIHMSGRNNKGGITTSYFITDIKTFRGQSNKKSRPFDPDGKPITYGYDRPINSFKRVKNSRYSADLDVHLNGANQLPTLRPLGTRVYSNRNIKRPNRSANNVHSIHRFKPTINKTRHQDIGSSIINDMYGKGQSVVACAKSKFGGLFRHERTQRR
ncbi:NlpC/P60 family protein [Geomonas sp. Red276]